MKAKFIIIALELDFNSIHAYIGVILSLLERGFVERTLSGISSLNWSYSFVKETIAFLEKGCFGGHPKESFWDEAQSILLEACFFERPNREDTWSS